MSALNPNQFGSEGGWDRSGGEPRWVQPHAELLKSALRSWKGAPVTMRIHMQDAGEGAPQPGSGSGKQMRAQAEALSHELAHGGGTNSRVLYRGAAHPPTGVESWTERRSVAERFARKNKGQVYSVTRGSVHGVRVADHVSDHESEWVLPAPGVFKQLAPKKQR